MEDGEHHYKKCIDKVSEVCPKVGIEFLCSDLSGNINALDRQTRRLLFLLIMLRQSEDLRQGLETQSYF